MTDFLKAAVSEREQEEDVEDGQRGKLIAAILTSGSLDEAATKAGVSRRTMFRRMRDRSFREAVGAARSQALVRTVSRLSELSVKALEVLAADLEHTSPLVRRECARALLNFHLAGQRALDAAERG